MHLDIPPEFETFARQQVAAGVVASETEVVHAALRHYLKEMKELKTSLNDAVSSLDRGEGIDGEKVFARLKTKYQRLANERQDC